MGDRGSLTAFGDSDLAFNLSGSGENVALDPMVPKADGVKDGN